MNYTRVIFTGQSSSLLTNGVWYNATDYDEGDPFTIIFADNTGSQRLHLTDCFKTAEQFRNDKLETILDDN